MTKPRVVGLPAAYADWLTHSFPESSISQQPADRFRQPKLPLFHTIMLQAMQFVPQAVAQKHKLKMPQLVAAVDGENLLWQIPWGHHALLLEKMKDPAVRCWYMTYSMMQGWSRNIVACRQALAEQSGMGAELDRLIRQKLAGLGYDF